MAETGIYEIRNRVNGKRYVGSAANNVIRWRAHRASLNAGRHHSRHLQAAWRKHGADAFDFTMIELCERDELIEREQAAFARLRPEYNICPTAGSSMGRRFSEESKAKIGAANRGKTHPPRSAEYRVAVSDRCKGKQPSPAHMAALQAGRASAVRTDEVKAQVSAALRAAYADGRRSKERPPEYREKIAASLRGRSLSPEHRAKVSAGLRGKKRGPYNLDPAKAEARREAGKKLAAAVNARRWGAAPPE